MADKFTLINITEFERKASALNKFFESMQQKQFSDLGGDYVSQNERMEQAFDNLSSSLSEQQQQLNKMKYLEGTEKGELYADYVSRISDLEARLYTLQQSGTLDATMLMNLEETMQEQLKYFQETFVMDKAKNIALTDWFKNISQNLVEMPKKIGDSVAGFFNSQVKDELIDTAGRMFLGPIYDLGKELLNLTAIQDKLTQLWTWSKGKLSPFFTAIKDKFTSFGSVLWESTKKMTSVLGAGIKKWIKWLGMLMIQKGLLKFGKSVWGGVTNIFASLMGKLKGFLPAITGGAALFSKGGMMALGKFVLTKAGPIAYLGNVLLQGIIGGFKSQEKSIQGRIAGVFSGIISAATFGIAKRENLEKDLNYIRKNMSWLGEGFKMIGQDIVNFFSSIKTQISKFVSSTLGKVGTFAQSVWGRIGQIFSDIKLGFTYIFDKVYEKVKPVIDFIGTIQKQIEDVIKNIRDIFNTLNPVDSLKENIGGFFGGVWSNVKGVFTGEEQPQGTITPQVMPEQVVPVSSKEMLQGDTYNRIYPETKVMKENEKLITEVSKASKESKPPTVVVNTDNQSTMDKAGMQVDNLGLVLISAGKL